MRIFIVGYDSLDPNYVEKLNSKVLTQKEYGHIFINTGILSTPTIWTSFITGLTPDKHGVIGFKWGKLHKLKTWIAKLGINRYIVDKSPFLLKQVAKFENHFNINLSFPSIKNKIPTIFDYAKNPIDISVPCYSDNMNVYEDLRHKLATGIGNPLEERQLLVESKQIFLEKRDQTVSALKEDWDLLMVHFFYPDIVQHTRWYDENEIEKLYRLLETSFSLFLNNVTDETLIFIISDHGQEKGIHTSYGFWSSNIKLNIKEPKITDFFQVIINQLGIPPAEQIDSIKQRLDNLGYI